MRKTNRSPAASPGFAALLRREPRPLAFGLLYTIAATIGQTFLISLFLPGMKTALGLGDAQVALLFTLATLASAVALWRAGAWIDRVDLLRYGLACAALLAASCVLIASATGVAALAVGLFALRLAGNGLLTHVAVTATVRHFVRDRGRALALVMLGPSLGEGLLPALLVPLVGAWGWRAVLAALGALGLALALGAASLVRRSTEFRRPPMRNAEAQAAVAPGGDARVRDRRYFLWTLPLFAGMWLVTTATIFHQALVAAAKGVSLQWFAVSFIAFAAVRVPVSVLTGRVVDRIGSDAVFCAHLAPLALGTVALIVVDTPWIVPVYWLCAGVTSGMGTVVQSTVVAERVARERLGKARSVLAAVGIVASAAGPSVYGFALAGGATITAVLWGSVALLAAASALGLAATRRFAS